jgi:tryptophan-rich hypothetical protein
MGISAFQLRAGAKWTAALPKGNDKHFELVTASGDEVELRCIVSGHHRVVSRGDLSNTELWLPGWR